MVLKSIHIKGFRAHEDSEVHFGDKINLLVGANGVGKTNILEAVHVLCLSRSFLTSSDRYVLRKGSSFYEVEGRFESQRRGSVTVRAAFVPGEGKKIFVGGAPLDRVSDLVGRFPIVVFSPEDHRLTSEGPQYRRRFLDNIISQSSPLYLDNLLRYRKSLKQRNEILQSSRKQKRTPDPVLLSSWTEELIKYGAAIIAERLKFVKAFSTHLEAAYTRVAAVVERPSLAYEPFADRQAPDEGLADIFRRHLALKQRQEIERGTTLVGPHRDDIDMHLGSLPVRRYASQGQHRTFGMALKLAQYDYLKNRTQEMPVLLLDDIFDNLDPDRITAFLDILASEAIGQSITTAARREIVHSHLKGRPCFTISVGTGARVKQGSEEIQESTKITTVI